MTSNIQVHIFVLVAFCVELAAAQNYTFRMGEDDVNAEAFEYTSYTKDTLGAKTFVKINANPLHSTQVSPAKGSTFAIDFLGQYGGLVLRDNLLGDSESLTVDGWYYIRQRGTGWLFQFGLYGTDGFGLYTTGGTIWGIYQGKAKPIAWNTGIPVPVDQWAHIIMTMDKGTFRVTVDGKAGVSKLALDYIPASDVVTLGARPLLGSQAIERDDFESSMDGMIDQWVVITE